MKKSTTTFLSLLMAGGLVAPLFMPKDALAIPAFTRQHKTECFTCHTIFPELTEQGENFKKNSYVWLDTKGHSADSKKKDDKKDSKKGLNEREYLLLSSIPDYVPLSLLGTFNASWADNRSDTGNRFDFVTRAIVLDAGGSFNDKLGFWLSYNLYTAGPFDPVISGANLNANTPHNNTPDINEAFVQARHLFNTPVNLKVGRMRPDLSLWKGTNKTSIVSPMATTSYRVGDSGFYTDSPSDGMELNTILKGRFFVAAGAVKRKNQKNLEGFGSIQMKIGGADFDGREAPVNLDAEESIFDYLTMTLGGYGYSGINEVGVNKQNNHYYRAGGEGDIRYQRYRLKLASAFGHDDNAIITNTTTNPLGGLKIGADSKVYAAEAVYLFGSSLIPSFRYEYEDTGATITRRYIPTLAYAALQNAKVVVEYKHSDQNGFLPANIVNMTLTATF